MTLPRAKPDDIAGEAIDLSFQKCGGDLCNSQGCDGVAPANCESFLHLIFEHIGGAPGSVCATGHCYDAIFRSELTEGRARQALQPSALSECRKINPG